MVRAAQREKRAGHNEGLDEKRERVGVGSIPSTPYDIYIGPRCGIIELMEAGETKGVGVDHLITSSGRVYYCCNVKKHPWERVKAAHVIANHPRGTTLFEPRDTIGRR